MLRLEFVYVVTGELGFVKIGICRPPEMPADSLRTDSIRPIEIAWVGATNGDAHAIELEAHRRLGASRHQDEWFAMPVERAIRAVEWAARELDHPLLSVGPLNAYARPRRLRRVSVGFGAMLRSTFVRIGAAVLVICGLAGFAFANRAALSKLWGALF